MPLMPLERDGTPPTRRLEQPMRGQAVNVNSALLTVVLVLAAIALAMYIF